MADFRYVKPGDTVTRLLGGEIPMQLLVGRVTDDLIYCLTPDGSDAWTFDRVTGSEVDDELQWGPRWGRTGSFLVHRATH